MAFYGESPVCYIAGNIVVDTIKYIDAYPNKLELTNVTRIERALGGLCCNVAIDMARLDPKLDVKAVGCTGADENGEYVRREFARYPSIDMRYLGRQGTTTFTDVMTVEGTGERTFFTYLGADRNITPDAIAALPFKQGDMLHLGYALLLPGLDGADAEYGTGMARALADAQGRGAVTSLDVVSSSTGDFSGTVPHALKYTDILTINEYEASRITGIDLTGALDSSLLHEALQTLIKLGVKRLAVIHTPSISAAMDAGGAYFEANTPKLPEGYIVSSVGAGDAFAAGLLCALVRGYDTAFALNMANVIAAMSLRSHAATESVPRFEEAVKTQCVFKGVGS